MWGERQIVVNGEQLEVRSVRVSDEALQLTGYYPVIWFECKLREFRWKAKNLYADFKLSEALKQLYSLIWDDFCGSYLEFVKPAYGEPISKGVYEKTLGFFSELLQQLHPFMPFITEEIFHHLKERDEDICVTQISKDFSLRYTATNYVPILISKILEFRAKNKLPIKSKIKIYIVADKYSQIKHLDSSNNLDFRNSSIIQIIKKQVNASELIFDIPEIPEGTSVLVYGEDKFYIESKEEIDTVALKEDLLKDLEYQKGFLQTVLKKLSNERFVQNAKPEVVEIERKKQADAEARIKTIEESLANL